MSDHLTPEQRQAFLEDVAAFAAGELSEERGAALLAAARGDATIMQALRAEESLDRLLELYEYPDLPEGIEGRFWQRFQEEKFDGEILGGGRRWWLKLAVPIAAAILLAIGLIYLPPNSDTGDQVGGTTKVGGNPPVALAEPESEDDFVLPFVAAEPDSAKPEELKPEQLKALKAMDDARLQSLGELQDAEDARLMDSFDTLDGIEPHKEQ